MKILVLTVLFAFIALSAADDERDYPIFDRTCDERKEEMRESVKQDFNVAAYSGTWFEIERYQQRDEEEADCMRSNYAWLFMSRVFDIDRTGWDFNSGNPVQRSARALLSFPDVNPRVGMLNVTYYQDREADEVNYYVLGTDYFNYAVIWACENIENDQSREFAFILARYQEITDPAIFARIETFVDRFLDRRFLRWTIQDDGYCLDRVSPGRKP